MAWSVTRRQGRAGRANGQKWPVWAVGIACLGLGVFMLVDTPETNATAIGTVTSVYESTDGDTCGVTADFVVDGQTFEARPGVQSGGMCAREVGDSIEVRYDWADPTVNDIGHGQTTFGWLAIGMGAVFLAVMGRVTFRRAAEPAQEPSTALVHDEPAVLAQAPPATQQQATQQQAPAAGGSPSIAPGWYRTADGAHERWHDGVDWTGRVRETGS